MTQPTDSIATIQELSSAVMGMGESAANSLGMIGAVHATPRPAMVKVIEAEREIQRQSVTYMGKCNTKKREKESKTELETESWR